MNRIEEKLTMLKEKNQKAFITYTTAGLPDLEGTKKLIRAQEEAGVDLIELGVPFSDPVADGPVIQNASYQAICKGVTLKKVFHTVEQMRAEGIQLVSPVSGKRIPKILEHARGFVYCVSSMGVTGQAASFHKEVISYLTQVKQVSKIPVMMGFGIWEAQDVAPMKDITDGAIVGSHFITLLEKNNFSTIAAANYCNKFKQDLNNL